MFFVHVSTICNSSSFMLTVCAKFYPVFALPILVMSHILFLELLAVSTLLQLMPPRRVSIFNSYLRLHKISNNTEDNKVDFLIIR
jgi:hypothetical protein